MTIQEAIEHCREEAAKNRTRAVEHANAYDRENAEACHECAQEHEQLAGWLEELQQRRGRAKELAALDDLRHRFIETGRLCVASGVRAAIQTLIDLTNEEIVKQEESGDAPAPRRRAGTHERWIGVEVEGQSGTGPVYAKVTCSGCGFENDHEPMYCECCGSMMDGEEGGT